MPQPEALVVNSQKGFTLLEIIIAVTILAFLSIYTAESIQRATSSKRKIQGRIDSESEVRDALKIMGRDIRLAFNYRDINTKLHNDAQAARQKRDNKKKNPTTANGQTNPGTTGTTTTNANANTTTQQAPKTYELKKETIVTQFQGSAQALHFTSLSNIRRLKDAQTSDQAEIGYFLKSCRARLKKSDSSECLWRRVSQVIDEDVEKGGTETVLLENVESFKLRYIGPEREKEWVDLWKTGEGSDDLTKGVFPYAVEVSLKVKNKNKEKSRTVAMTMVAPLRFPNNEKKKSSVGNENEETPTTPQENGANETPAETTN